jgi:tetratricopeptide (TPR) repeat protein
MRGILFIFILALIWNNQPFVVAQGNAFLKGRVAFENNDFLKAKVFFDEHLSLFPKHREARLLRAKTNLNLAEYQRALDDLEVVNLSSDNEIILLQARSLAGLGIHKAALEKLNQYKNTSFKIAEPILIAYPEFAALKNLEEWKSLWKNWQYSERESELINVQYAIKTGRNEEAADRLDLFLSRYKTNADAYFQRGNLFFKNKDFKNALVFFEQAVSLNSSKTDYKLANASALIRLKQYKKALEAYNMVLSADSLAINAYLGRAEAHMALAKYSNALADISYFRYYYPNHIEAQYIEANIFTKTGDYLQAISGYGKLINSDPSHPEFFIGRADAYTATKTYLYATRDYSMALDLDPKNVEVYKKKAKAHHLAGDLPGACAAWKHAARLGDQESLRNLQRYCRTK